MKIISRLVISIAAMLLMILFIAWVSWFNHPAGWAAEIRAIVGVMVLGAGVFAWVLSDPP